MADLEVVVAGGGNAALCAAITAREKGAAVTPVSYTHLRAHET